MVLWGIILVIAGFLTALVTFLDTLSTLTGNGFGAWVNEYFNFAGLSGEAIAMFIGAALLLIGVVLFIVGKIKAAKRGEADAQTQKGAKFFRGLKGEFKNITWPTWPTVLRNTGVTLALCVILGIFIVVVDAVLGLLVGLFAGLG